MDKNILVITLVILLISVFVGFNFIYEPKVSELRQLEKMQNEEQEKGVLFEEIQGYEKKIKMYEGRWVPRGKEEIELLNRVREIAGDSQVHVASLVPQFKEEHSGKGYRKFPIVVSFEGTYPQLGDFISMAENTGTFMKIDRLEFSTTAQSESDLPLACEVTLSVFSIP